MKIKLVNICWGLMCFISACFAQGKYDNQWVVSDRLGITFNSELKPTIDTSYIWNLNYLFQPISFSDSNGNLILYGGTTMHGGYDINLFNKYQTLLKGMDMLTQPTVRFTQFKPSNLAILPFSKNVDTLLLIQFSRWNSMYKHRLMYSIIDTKAYSDTGSVNSFNNTVLKFTGVSDIFGCIRHANGRDWWILTHGFPNNKFYKFIATPWKVEFAGEQFIGENVDDVDLHYTIRRGYFCANDQGTRICINNTDGIIEVFNFDRCSGILTNPVNILKNSKCYIKTMSFSPSGRFLYCIYV